MRTILNLLSMATIVVLIASCSSAPKDKKTQLAELKQQQKELAEKIQKLEVETQSSNPESVPANVKEVSVREVVSTPFHYLLQTQGGVEAEQNIMVSAKAAGLVTHVYVKEGERVGVGQTLAQIDNTLILKGIEELKGSLELAKTVYERQKSLWDQKIGTEIQYLTAKNNKESLERKLATMNEQNDMTRIKSQISGTVEDVLVKVGENTAPGQPAVRVIGNSNLKIVANVSEAYINSIKAGNPVTVQFSDIDKSFEGRVTFVGRNINPLSRSFSVEVPVPSGLDARPNMAATVKIIFNTVPDALAVPVNLVQTVNNQKILYVAESVSGKTVARKHIVEVGGIFNNMAEIKSGLSAGDKVITVGYQGLNDGEAIAF